MAPFIERASHSIDYNHIAVFSSSILTLMPKTTCSNPKNDRYFLTLRPLHPTINSLTIVYLAISQ